jgi:hypothetical protein
MIVPPNTNRTHLAYAFMTCLCFYDLIVSNSISAEFELPPRRSMFLVSPDP